MLGNAEDAVRVMKDLAAENDIVSVFWDQKRDGDHPEITVTTGTVPLEPRVFLTDKVYGELRDQGIIGEDNLRTFRDRRLHVFSSSDTDGE